MAERSRWFGIRGSDADDEGDEVPPRTRGSRAVLGSVEDIIHAEPGIYFDDRGQRWTKDDHGLWHHLTGPLQGFANDDARVDQGFLAATFLVGLGIGPTHPTWLQRHAPRGARRYQAYREQIIYLRAVGVAESPIKSRARWAWDGLTGRVTRRRGR